MKDIVFEVLSNFEQAPGFYRLELKSLVKIPQVTPGQFLHIEMPDKRLILRRPFCIYDYTDYTVVTNYAVVGKGTQSMTQLKQGDSLKVLLPLGNGFDITAYKRIGLLGGGMGSAELYSVTRHSKDKEFYAYLGFSNKGKVLFESDFAASVKELRVFTGDGSHGIKGRPIPAILNDIDKLDVILLCGPGGFVKAAADALLPTGKPVFVSLEQRMGCGVGACLVCVCGIREGDKIKNKRVCMDGPVFNLKDVVL